MPVVKFTAVAKEMVPMADVFLKTEIVFVLALVTTKSGLPLPSKSLMATYTGCEPGKSALAANDTVPEVLVFLKTATVLLVGFAITISGLPSPSKSPVTIPRGEVPVVKSTFVAKVIVPNILVLRKTETLNPFPLLTRRSVFPSPSIS